LLACLLSAVEASRLMSAVDADMEPREAPHIVMPGRTLVRDQEGRQVLWIDGVLPLPAGARIELTEPRADGVVTQVRLVAAGPHFTPDVVLDVRLEEAGGGVVS
jgi:hypothetical protein